VPLPIPTRHDRRTMADVRVDGVDLGALLGDLSGGRHALDTRVHLDPDLDRRPDARLPGWRPSLGQTLSAQSHLAKSGVGAGDAFLFFGWFRQTERRNGRWRFAPKAPDLHVLFGWLEVEDVLAIVAERERCLQRHPWIADHPHVVDPVHYDDRRNTLYVAPERSRHLPARAGGGAFRTFAPELQLTAADSKTRSRWAVPAWMRPGPGREPLSYHADARRWTEREDDCLLQTVAKGQEFVLRTAGYPAAAEWFGAKLRAGTSGDEMA
jgi:hypothetical protein